uniref:Uncharacterized protein n=1 Tax=Arion vulgaris TaxID=1028688 RepID=A0A0B7AAR5_9EUPU
MMTNTNEMINKKSTKHNKQVEQKMSTKTQLNHQWKGKLARQSTEQITSKYQSASTNVRFHLSYNLNFWVAI